MRRITIYLLLACLCFFPAFKGVAQSRDGVSIMPGAGLAVDSMTRVSVARCLGGWLRGKEHPTAVNEYSGTEDVLAAKFLMQELWLLDRNILKKDSASGYCCYVTNVDSLNDGDMLVQFAYLGVRDKAPKLAASFSVVAGRKGDRWYFSSPLTRNTMGWKKQRIGPCTFYYKDVLNGEKAAAFSDQIVLDDGKVKARPVTVDFYCCDDYMEAMHIAGVDYRLDYSGYAYQDQDISDSARTLFISGMMVKDHFNEWDPHDLWHDRLHRVMPTTVINRPVDEGCAYLFGGSWGKSWAEVLGLMEDYARAHPDADWLNLYRDGANLIPPPKDIKISYAINALIARQLDRENRFSGMMELLSCGKKEEGDANYFAALRKVTGVDTAGFNRYVWGLIGFGIAAPTAAVASVIDRRTGYPGQIPAGVLTRSWVSLPAPVEH